MDKKQMLLEKLARLAAEVGANVQKDQIDFINSPIHAAPLARLIQKEAYILGAKKVYIDWNDSEVAKNHYMYATLETLSTIEDFQYQKMKYKTCYK